MRWDLIDSFEILKKGSHSLAVKRFTGLEDFFQEHYPGRPVVPEPFYIEMIAQAGGVLYGLELDFKKEVILAKVAEADFKKAVSPPCVFTVRARFEKMREEGAWVSGEVRLGQEAVATASILLVSMPLLSGRPDTSVVFNDAFLRHYKIAEVVQASL